MLLLIKSSRNVLQFRNCLNYLNHHVNHQSNLARTIKLDDNKFNISTLFNQKINNELNNQNLNQSVYSKSIFLSSKKESIKNVDSKKNLNKRATIEKSTDLANKQSSPNQDPNNDLPSREQLEEFYLYIEKMFPKFFLEKINLYYFDQYVLIEDNQSGVSQKTRGYDELIKKISFIRIYHSCMYSKNQMTVLSIAKIPTEGLVKVRWRIISKGRLLAFIKFWRFLQFNKKEILNDGIVYFHLNKSGKVNRIVIEKIDKNKIENVDTTPLEKLVKV